MNHSKIIHSENQKFSKDTREIDGNLPNFLRICHNITAIFTWLGFMGDFGLLKQKTCSLFHEILLLQKFNYAFTQVLEIFSSSLCHLSFSLCTEIVLTLGVGGSKIVQTPLRKIKMVPAHWLKNKASNQPDVKSWIIVIQYKCGLHVH